MNRKQYGKICDEDYKIIIDAVSVLDKKLESGEYSVKENLEHNIERLVNDLGLHRKYSKAIKRAYEYTDQNEFDVRDMVSNRDRVKYWSDFGGYPTSNRIITYEEYLLSLSGPLGSPIDFVALTASKLLRTYRKILFSNKSLLAKEIIRIDNYTDTKEIKLLIYFPFIAPMAQVDHELKGDIYDINYLYKILNNEEE